MEIVANIFVNMNHQKASTIDQLTNRNYKPANIIYVYKHKLHIDMAVLYRTQNILILFL